MRKLLMIFMIFLLSCGTYSKRDLSEIEFKTINIEGCEYLISKEYKGNSGYGLMAHKGNCNNRAHFEEKNK